MLDIVELEKIMQRLSPRIPATIDYWSTKEIASILKRSENVVRDHIVHVPGFPAPYRIPSRNKGRSHPLWKASEVLAWIDKYREKR